MRKLLDRLSLGRISDQVLHLSLSSLTQRGKGWTLAAALHVNGAKRENPQMPEKANWSPLQKSTEKRNNGSAAPYPGAPVEEMNSELWPWEGVELRPCGPKGPPCS